MESPCELLRGGSARAQWFYQERRGHIIELSVTESVESIADAAEAAQQIIAEDVYRTPLEQSVWLSEVTGADVSLKLECYQPTGSFKVRGASAAVRQLAPEDRARGVVTASAGNHGLGLAYASARAGVHATVVVPENASSAKVHALRRFPIELRFGGESYDTAERMAIELAATTGAHFISPYNHPWVIAGQGTVGLELLEPDGPADVVVIPVGGGGLISGVGSVLKVHSPSARVIGVQASNSPAMAEALNAGRLVAIPILHTIADGLAANIEPGSRTFPLAQQVVDEMVLITEEEMEATIRYAFTELHLSLEGSAVVGIAALLGNKVSDIKGKRVACIVTGRNIATERLVSILSAGE